MERPSILFYVDESLRRRDVREILGTRGHELRWLDFGTKDPAIIEDAELHGGVIIASDRFFYNALRQGSYHEHRKRRRYERAGIIAVAGEWALAREQLSTWIPVIEALYLVQSSRGRRTVVLIDGVASVKIDA